MIVPDVNLLVYAYNSEAPRHAEARRWWEACLSGSTSVGLSWATLTGYIRVMTSRAVLLRPLDPAEAIGHVREWLHQPQALVLVPGPRHLDLLETLVTATGAAGRLTTDLHIAALAMENQAELHSDDTDFARFPGLRWHDPLADSA